MILNEKKTKYLYSCIKKITKVIKLKIFLYTELYISYNKCICK